MNPPDSWLFGGPVNVAFGPGGDVGGGVVGGTVGGVVVVGGSGSVTVCPSPACATLSGTGPTPKNTPECAPGDPPIVKLHDPAEAGHGVPEWFRVTPFALQSVGQVPDVKSCAVDGAGSGPVLPDWALSVTGSP